MLGNVQELQRRLKIDIAAFLKHCGGEREKGLEAILFRSRFKSVEQVVETPTNFKRVLEHDLDFEKILRAKVDSKFRHES